MILEANRVRTFGAGSTRFSRIRFSLFVLALGLSACSGGGGGGGDESTGGSSGPGSLKRSTSTGIRFIHGAIDEAPLSLLVDGVEVLSASFGDETFYQAVSPGEHRVALARKNAQAEIVYDRALTFAEKSEYSLVAVGEARNDTFQARFIADSIEKVARGSGRVQVVNGYGGRDGIRVSCGDQQSDAVTLGEGSEFIEIPATPVPCSISTDNGTLLAQPTITPVDGGEIALAVVGSSSLGLRFVKTFRDLD